MAIEKKRKRTNVEDTASSKKRDSTFPRDDLSISLLKQKDELPPVLAVPMGLTMPHQPMQVYREGTRDSSRSKADLELLLHSSDHPRLDFTAREEFGASVDQLLNHYIGVFDPKTGEMEVVKAKNMAVRTSLRPTQKQLDEVARKKDYQTMLDQRQALGMEFGTKKSKNMIRARNENLIVSNTSVKQSAATKALLASVAVNIENMPTMEEMQQSAEQNKPRPVANRAATSPEEVYPLGNLIPEEVMYKLNVDDWIEATESGEGVVTTSRYVSRRIASTLRTKDERKMKTLKYILMIIEWFQKGKSARNGRRPPRFDDLEPLGHPKALMAGIHKRFVPVDDNMLDAWAIDNLQTHVMALAMYMDDFNVDLEDIKDDFRLSPMKTTDLFRSLGCKITPPTDREKVQFRMTSLEVKNRRFARLTLPLDFPVDRSGRKQKGR